MFKEIGCHYLSDNSYKVNGIKKLKLKYMFFMLIGCAFVQATYAENHIDPRCVELKKIDVDDDKILDKLSQEPLFEKYIGSCIEGKLLKGIIADISQHFINLGYITTKPYLKNQTITDGQIDISILNGTIEEIVDTETGEVNSRIKSAFAFQKGGLLNLRELETALEMMNRPASTDSKFKIKPGDKPGASIVDIESEDSYPFHLKLGVSGRERSIDKNLLLTADLTADNLFNINDVLQFQFNGGSIQKVYQSNRGGEVNFSFPISSYLVELVRSDTNYRQGVVGLNETYLSKGNTEGNRIRINKVLYRDQRNKLNTAFSIYHKETQSYFSNQLIDVSSYKTTLAQIDITHTCLQSWGQLTTTYSYYQGTDWFGARTDDYVNAEAASPNFAKLQFVKQSTDLNFLYYLKDRSYQVSSNFHLQRSGDLLYDNDKLSIGSDYSVRGYFNSNLYGNSAYYIRNDLKKSWNVNKSPELLKTVSLSAGLDYGKVKCEVDNLSSCGVIYGTALSLASQAGKLATNFAWSFPLKKISESHQLRGLIKFDLTWMF